MAPAGFKKIKPGKSVDLTNKQIYLAQVPSDFDPRKAEFKSDTEIVSDGTTYFVNSSASIADCSILVPKDDDLVPIGTKVTGLLAFTKRVSLPKVDYDSVTIPRKDVPQHENLRMRHFPTGYGLSAYGVKEEKEQGDESASGKRRKHTEQDENVSSSKKQKKDKSHDKHEKGEKGDKKKKKKSKGK